MNRDYIKKLIARRPRKRLVLFELLVHGVKESTFASSMCGTKTGPGRSLKFVSEKEEITCGKCLMNIENKEIVASGKHIQRLF